MEEIKSKRRVQIPGRAGGPLVDCIEITTVRTETKVIPVAQLEKQKADIEELISIKDEQQTATETIKA